MTAEQTYRNSKLCLISAAVPAKARPAFLLSIAVGRARDWARLRPIETVVDQAYRHGVEGSRVHVTRELREMLAYLRRSSAWVAADCDTGSKHERLFRRSDDAVARESAQAVPVDRVERFVIHSDNDQRVRILPLGLLDSPFDRHGLALIVEIRMAVMRVRVGCHCGYDGSRCEHRQTSLHTMASCI